MKPFHEIDTNPSRAELVKFGLVMVGAAAAGGAWAWGHGHARGGACIAAAGAAVFLIAFLPVVGRLAYIAWMSLGVAIGRVTAPIVLLVVYAVLVVPVGVAMRLRGRDMLRLRRDEKAVSYWEDYPRAEGISSYLRQS